MEPSALGHPSTLVSLLFPTSCLVPSPQAHTPMNTALLLVTWSVGSVCTQPGERWCNLINIQVNFSQGNVELQRIKHLII